MAETKSAFRRRVGRLMNILHSAVTSGTGDFDTVVALTLTDFYPSDDALNSAAIYDVAGAEWRVVTDWLASTGTATVNRNFTATQASGRSIDVFEQFNPDQLDDALRMALDEAYPYIATRVVDTSLTGITGQYEYTIPATIRDLNRMLGGRVQVEADTSISTFPYWNINHWEVRESGGASKTLLLQEIAGFVGRTIRLIGLGVPTFPSTDVTSVDLESDTLQLLAYKAAEILYRSGARSPGRDAEFSEMLSKKYGQMFEDKKDVWGVPLKPTSLQPSDNYPALDAPLSYYHTPTA
jgi:hypothetical protein